MSASHPSTEPCEDVLALTPYLKHHAGCRLSLDTATPCSCGLANILGVLGHGSLAARSAAPQPEFVDELLIADRLRAAPSVEARDAEPWLLLEAAAELEYAATHAPWRPTPQVVSNVLGIARRLRETAARASLLPPEKT